jgi:glycosyltransferase involved in cell wall biosynthesis
VYNEAGSIAACLRAIAAQTVAPYEVIVVDNNSTDATALIAADFPFVRIVRERRQGVVHARNAGFDAARGDIIGRIDGDSRIAADWVERLIETFTTYPLLDALSGSLEYYDIACRRLIDAVDAGVRGWLGRRTTGAVYLLGANMAIRKAAWSQVRDATCNRTGVHEDLDLAAHMALERLPVAYVPQVVAGISGRRADSGFVDFARYLFSLPSTYRHHGLWQRVYFYPVIALVAVFHFFLRSIYRGYDAEAQRFSLRSLLRPDTTRRVNPVTFGD